MGQCNDGGEIEPNDRDESVIPSCMVCMGDSVVHMEEYVWPSGGSAQGYGDHEWKGTSVGVDDDDDDDGDDEDQQLRVDHDRTFFISGDDMLASSKRNPAAIELHNALRCSHNTDEGGGSVQMGSSYLQVSSFFHPPVTVESSIGGGLEEGVLFCG